MIIPGDTGYTYWTIQHLQVDGEWVFSNYDNSPSEIYHKSYESWEHCGEQGFLSEKDAVCALMSWRMHQSRMESNWPNDWTKQSMRVVKITTTHKTTVLSTFEPYAK